VLNMREIDESTLKDDQEENAEVQPLDFQKI
jgi:hypothetical protein